MNNIILNTKNVKDYKINPYNKYEYYHFNQPILSEFRKSYSKDDILIDIIDETISHLNHTPYVLIKVSPENSVDFIPFCCVIISYTAPLKNENGSYVINHLLDDLFNDPDILIPKQRNSVINRKPIMYYKSNWECRLKILEEYFPEVLDKIDIIIDDPDKYSDHDYCLLLDEMFDMVTGNTTGIPIPEPDTEFLIKHVNRLF